MNSNHYQVIVLLLLILLFWFGATIIRLENFHYATQVGFCADVNISERANCLDKKETRTNPVWHLLYGLKVL